MAFMIVIMIVWAIVYNPPWLPVASDTSTVSFVVIFALLRVVVITSKFVSYHLRLPLVNVIFVFG